ncbi:SGNH/GDSL hydrolase family protein [Dyadobacter fanqingshengii]|uniref:GDSL-type esterase/lipase family protein n=1 Tax=Dyadobacter fanqingshengii TaxID=2906443 RepID=A0A9X1PED0_9BACT|nr:SGNH/GDSL hydrolase family protein [Dyadobacter fanqingshengii]MCF0042328.1 GDSL-type esterase/lipase family protein [Dyadobacter fanqingshengii]USJ35145.1 GDSL-type esterase/lipase family protein [Dyadobacter fanqingshengii]
MTKRILIGIWFAVLLVSGPFIAAQPTEKVSIWKGFEKVEFTFENKNAWFVKPQKAIAGNPWVWRAHFPTWHTEMDSILLSRGFHIAYINTNDMFAHPKAMQVWDAFYDYLVNQKQFAPKVALEGVSRGGLYVYGWAKRNPDKVSCIYAEAPVCDPKSWPGGRGKGLGSEKDWAVWLKLFNVTEDEAAKFTDIPLNDLVGLASYKVPIIHAIGLKDKHVPAEENSDLLVKNYMQLGGPISVYPMTRGEQEMEGHHFPIEHPEYFANFIEQHSVPVQKNLSHMPYIQVNKGLGNAFEKFRKEKKGTVAFLGGSITHNPGWRDKTAQYLKEHFPETDFTFIAAGIPSLGSTPHAFRFERDVLAKGTPDLLFLEAAVNDRGNGFSEKAQIKGLEGILRHLYAANPNANAVLMAFAEPGKNADYEKGKEPVEVAVHERVAKHYGTAYINLAKEVYDRITAGEFSWKYDFKDLHPSPYGQEVYFQTIKELLKTDSSAATNAIKLPAPMDRFSYEKGSYHEVAEAKNLKGFTLNPDWKPADKTPTRPGFVNVPMLVGEQPNASLDFEFKGRGVGIAIISGPDAGKITYTIDGKKPQTLDFFTPWSNQLHLPWYLMLSDELSSGKHKLHLTIASEKNEKSTGNACRIVYFLVNE